MSDTPEAPKLLSPQRLAEIERMLAVSAEAYLGMGINGDDVEALLAMYKGQKLLYNETSRIANKQRNDFAVFRQQVADELVKLRALAVELCIHGGHIQPEEIDEIATRLQIDLSTPTPSA